MHCRRLLLVPVIGFATGSLSLLCAQDAPKPPAPPSEQAPKPEPIKEDTAAFIAKLDGVPGYGGIAFGTEFDKVKVDFKLEQDRGPLKLYKKKDETLTVGPATLETVLYYFFNGKLYGVAFHTNDGQDSLNLLSVFRHAFGIGQTSADSGPATIWIGKTNGALFDLNTSTGDASAFLFNQAAHDEYLKYESEAAQKAADQLLKGK